VFRPRVQPVFFDVFADQDRFQNAVFYKQGDEKEQYMGTSASHLCFPEKHGGNATSSVLAYAGGTPALLFVK